MTMASNTSDAVAAWNQTTIQLNRYFSMFIFIVNTIGNLLNIAVLVQPKLRSNPCASLFLASSVASLVSVLVGLSMRALSSWNIDPTATLTWFCQLRNFVLFTSRTIAYCLIALASIDRWLSSCVDVHRRQLSTSKNAQRGIVAISVCSCLLFAPMFVCYEASLLHGPLKCYGRSFRCNLWADLTYTCAATLGPLIVTFSFGWMTIVNVRQVQRRVQPWTMATLTTGAHLAGQQRPRRVDHYLLLMLLIQVLLFALLTLPLTVHKLYALVRLNELKDAVDRAKEQFIFNFFLLFAYLANGMSFYIYTLFGGRTFRRELLNMLRRHGRSARLFILIQR